MKVFRIDEVKEDSKTKRVHSLVTDAEEIKALLDEHDGGNGVVDGVYYYFSTVMPDNRAIDSLLNRALGKPTEHHKVEVSDTRELALAQIREWREAHPKLRLETLIDWAAEDFNIDKAELVSEANN